MPHQEHSSATSDVRESLRSLFYRYWFWEWLFIDVACVRDRYQRSAAWHHNRAQRRYLPVYMRRWMVMLAGNLALAAALEKALSWVLPAAVFYTNSCISVCVVLVTFVGWVLLGRAEPSRG
jgi:hypothetical protein